MTTYRFRAESTCNPPVQLLDGFLYFLCSLLCFGLVTGFLSATAAAQSVVQVPATAVLAPSVVLRVSERPDLQIGARFGVPDMLFSRIDRVVQLSNGQIVVLDNGYSNLRFFSAKGTHLRTVGRSGNGPGEFADAHIVPAVQNDSVIILDLRNSRLSILSSAGRVIRERRVAHALPLPIGLLPDGRLLGRSFTFVGSQAEGTSVHVARFAIYSLSTGARQTIAVDNMPNVRSTDARGTMISADIPYAIYASAAIGQSSFVSTPGEVPEIDEYNLDGTLRRRISVRGMSKPLSAAQYHAAVEERAIHSVNPAATRRYYAAHPRPQNHPVWRSLLIDSEGAIWAEAVPLAGTNTATWHVFSADWRPLGAVTVPGGFAIKQIGRDFVLGIWRDADGVNYIRRYGLLRK